MEEKVRITIDGVELEGLEAQVFKFLLKYHPDHKELVKLLLGLGIQITGMVLKNVNPAEFKNIVQKLHKEKWSQSDDFDFLL